MKRGDIGTLLLVTLITLFVWALADSQTQRTAEVVTTIELVPAVDDRLLRVVGGLGPDGVVRIELEGPQAAYEQVRSAMLDGLVLRLERAISEGTGPISLGLATLLESQAPLAGSGVRILRCIPAEARVEVQPAVRTVLPVRVELEAGESATRPTSDPTSVVVQVPASLEAVMPASVLVTVPAAATATMRAYEPASVEGLVARFDPPIPDAWGITIAPSRVSATVTLRGRTSEAVVAEVDVEFSLPPDELGLWRVTVPREARVLRAVGVRGPTASVARVTSGVVSLRAIARLSAEQLATGVFEVVPEVVGLPQGVALVEPVAPIRVTAERLPASTAAPE
ncbi:MAG: hypothetical protein AAF235_03765 [Planctomycetota bacterium]